MAHRNRMHSILARSAAAAGTTLFLASALPDAARAQPVPPVNPVEDALRRVREIERLFSEAESARLSGNCALRDERLNTARRRLSAAEEGHWITPDGLREYLERYNEAMARPCPPPGGTTPPPPPTGVVSPPTTEGTPPSPPPADQPINQHPDVARALAGMEVAITACNRAAFEALRADLITLIERMLETELNPRRRFQLNEFKNAVRRRQFRCEGTDARGRDAVILNFLYGPFYISSIGTGVIRPGPAGTEERYAATSDDRLDGYAIDAAVSLGRVTLGGGYEHAGGGRRGFTTQAGPNFGTGVVFGQLSEVNTSGYFAEFGSEGWSEVDFDTAYAEFMYDLFGDDKDDEPEAGPRQNWEGRFLIISGYVRYQYDWKDHRSSISSTGMSGGATFSFSQTREQSIGQSNIAVGADIRTRLAFSPVLSLSLMARGGPYHYDARLRSDEHNMANFGPAATRDFRIAIQDDADGIGFAGTLEARLEYKVGNAFSLSALGRFDYRSHDASSRVPVDGDEVFFDGRRIELEFNSRRAVYLGLGARFRF